MGVPKKITQKKDSTKKVTKIDEFKELINFKKSNILWMIYGILFGPIELAIIYFGVNTDGASGFFKLIGAMLVISFLFTFIPQIIRILLKLFKIDFYDEESMRISNICASGSVILTWLIGLIFFSDLNGGRVGLIITIIVLMIGVIGCHIPAIWLIYKILYSSDDYSAKSYTSSNSETNRSLFEENEKNHEIKTRKTRGDGRGFFYNKDGILGGTSMTDNHGTTFFNDSKGGFAGTATTDSNGTTYYKDSNGNVTGTSVTDSNGRTYYRDTEGKAVSTSVTDSNGTTFYNDTK